MEAAIAAAVGEVLKQGLPGVIILGLAYAYWRERKYSQDIQEKRIVEARQSVTALEQNTAATNNLVNVVTRRD